MHFALSVFCLTIIADFVSYKELGWPLLASLVILLLYTSRVSLTIIMQYGRINEQVSNQIVTLYDIKIQLQRLVRDQNAITLNYKHVLNRMLRKLLIYYQKTDKQSQHLSEEVRRASSYQKARRAYQSVIEALVEV